MQTRIRINSSRRSFLIADTRRRIVAALEHLGPEAEAFAEAAFGPCAGVAKGPESGLLYGTPVHPIIRLEAQLRRSASAMAEWAKRKPLRTTLPIAVAGEMPRVFGLIWRAYCDALGNAWAGTPASFRVEKMATRLVWGTGSYALLPGILAAGEDFADFSGQITVDPALIRVGGPFQVQITPQGLHFEGVGSKVHLWRVALGFIREHCKAPIDRSSLNYRDIIHRFRHGGKLCYAAVRNRCHSQQVRAETTVTLSGGAAAPELVSISKRRAARYGVRADIVSSYIEALEKLSLDACERFVANPEHQQANVSRELSLSEEAFREARLNLFRAAAEACYKKELPERAEGLDYGSLPSPKSSATDGALHRYMGATSLFTQAHDRWRTAIAAARQISLPIASGQMAIPDQAAPAASRSPEAVQLALF
jgi:hypothetical protein